MSMAQVPRLKPAFSDQQAEAPAGLFDEELATKRDIEVLKRDIETGLEQRTKREPIGSASPIG